MNIEQEALNRALDFSCLVLAFIGRDAGTDRLQATLDGLCEKARELDPLCREALAEIAKVDENKRDEELLAFIAPADHDVSRTHILSDFEVNGVKHAISELFVSSINDMESGKITLPDFHKIVDDTEAKYSWDDNQRRYYKAIRELAVKVSEKEYNE